MKTDRHMSRMRTERVGIPHHLKWAGIDVDESVDESGLGDSTVSKQQGTTMKPEIFQYDT